MPLFLLISVSFESGAGSWRSRLIGFVRKKNNSHVLHVALKGSSLGAFIPDVHVAARADEQLPFLLFLALNYLSSHETRFTFPPIVPIFSAPHLNNAE